MYRYFSLRLVDLPTAGALVVVALPLGVLGAIPARHVPSQALRIGYGAAMVALAWLLSRKEPGRPAQHHQAAPAVVVESDRSHAPCPEEERRRVKAAGGAVYDYCAHGLGLQRLISGAAASLAGLISTGVGEATLPGLVRRSHLPVAVAAATSDVVVAGTVTAPLPPTWWSWPGKVGSPPSPGICRYGRFREPSSAPPSGPACRGGRMLPAALFGGLFLAIGTTFLAAFTVFKARFA